MDIQLRPIQSLFIWRLLLEREPAPVSELKPALKKADRDGLVTAGLVGIEKRGRKLYVQLLDKGWEWASQHLDAELPTSGTASLYILRQFMIRLRDRLAGDGRNLADFFGTLPESRPQVSSEAAAPASLTSQPDHAREISQRILAACHRLGEGVHSTRIRIADLRSSLPDVPAGEFANSLRELERSQQIDVYPLDNRQEIRPEDEAASVPNSTGEPRHVVYLHS